MKISVPREIVPGERRVALVPDSVKKLKGAGFTVRVESGAGTGALIDDSDYEAAGAEIVPDTKTLYGEADAVLKVQPPVFNEPLSLHEVDLMPRGSVLVALVYPFHHPEAVKRLAEKDITAFTLDFMPRTTLAQTMDVLSSMSTVAGYKAALLAADSLPKFFPMLMTAAGTIAPARVFVIGAGVAGLQACATAKRLGAVVEAIDQRPAVKEQVESLGAKFVEVPTEEKAETEEGYAKELSEDYKRRQAEVIHRHVSRADAVITTALIPGKRAPLIITEEMVKSMRPGSVIVDLASDYGGNCELTEPGGTVVKHGVRIIGATNAASSLSVHASRLFSKNIERFFMHIADKDGLKEDMEDEIYRKTLFTRKGEILNEKLRELVLSIEG